MNYPEVPDSIFQYLYSTYENTLSYDKALNEFLDNYRLTNEQKEKLTENELTENRDLKDSIKKQAYEELHHILDFIKDKRRILKEYKDSDYVSDELREEIEGVLTDYKFTIQDLGELTPHQLYKVIENITAETEIIGDKFKEEQLEIQDELEEEIQEERDYENMRGTYEPMTEQDRIAEYEEREAEYQPYQFQPIQLPGYNLQRIKYPKLQAFDRPEVDESIHRENEYYESQIVRLQQLMISDPLDEHNSYYAQLLGLLRQKIKENQGIIHDSINYHIGPSEIDGDLQPEDEDNILINRQMTYQNLINRRMVNATQLRQDEDIQKRLNKAYIEGKYQFAPQKGFRPYVSRQLWESMVEGSELGWAASYPGFIKDYNKGIFGNRFTKDLNSWDVV